MAGYDLQLKVDLVELEFDVIRTGRRNGLRERGDRRPDIANLGTRQAKLLGQPGGHFGAQVSQITRGRDRQTQYEAVVHSPCGVGHI